MELQGSQELNKEQARVQHIDKVWTEVKDKIAAAEDATKAEPLSPPDFGAAEGDAVATLLTPLRPVTGDALFGGIGAGASPLTTTPTAASPSPLPSPAPTSIAASS